jgi:Icc protein
LDRIKLQQGDALEALLKAHGDVRHLFCGHLHRPVHGVWRGIPFSTLRATSHQVAPTFGGGELSLMTICEAPEYAVVFVSDEAVIVPTHAFLEEEDWLDNLDDPRLEDEIDD